MKIKDVIVEQGVGRELWRRATLRPEQKRELEQLETILVRLTKLPLERVQKNSKDILKQYKELLNRNDDWEKDPIGREVALAKAIRPYYPDTAAQIIAAYSDEKKEINKTQQKPAPAQTQKSSQTTAKFQPRTPNVWRRRPEPFTLKISQGKPGAGQIVTKTSDGWFNQKGEKITKPWDIEILNRWLELELDKRQIRTIK